jgi:prevent-host-death family protein
MSEIGVFEAWNHLSQLLVRVLAGEEFTITRRGRPVARLVAVDAHDPGARQRAIEELRSFSTGRHLGEGGSKSFLNTGRRW